VAKVDIAGLDCKVEVLINYEWYLILYRLCFRLKHLIKDCKWFGGRRGPHKVVTINMQGEKIH
jgi:hypothetical protein